MSLRIKNKSERGKKLKRIKLDTKKHDIYYDFYSL